ncbi:MAG TPA: aldo/keto reductase [Candidatus Didemnitutus sp.]|jgi:aryl-alcohol dehydrogenase-like predicted oxidoreductase
MQQRPLGNTGLTVSAIGFGAWQLANPLWGGPDEGESIRLVHAALDAGCTFFDTAPNYGGGGSERLLGKALRGRRRHAVVCTKFGHTDSGTSDFSAVRLRSALEDSLRRLQSDHVDVLLLHNPPTELLDATSRASDLHSTLADLQREGKIRVSGASVDHGRDLHALAAGSAARVAEVLFNAFHQEPRLAFDEVATRGLGLIAKVPLDSGWLGGRYGATSQFEGIRGRWTPAVIARRAALVRQLRALLPSGLPLASAALGFVLAHSAIATVIPGVKSLHQLEANLAGARTPLSSDIVAAIQKLWATELAGAPLPW